VFGARQRRGSAVGRPAQPGLGRADFPGKGGGKLQGAISMETRFEKTHEDQLLGTLTMADRLIIRGHLLSFWYKDGLARFLRRLGVYIKRDFGRYARDTSEKVKAHAKKIADENGRPLLYQRKVVRQKDELARKIAKKDGITEGLICVMSTLELAQSFSLRNGWIGPAPKKCLHFYFYLIHPELGFMHVRLQSWFPFQIQIYLNGHEWLARQLDKHGIGYERYQNTFLRIDDLKTARKLCRKFPRRKWARVFGPLARRVNPILPLIKKHNFGSYYWVIDACEVATDLMWRDRPSLLGILDQLFQHAVTCFSADTLVRFLGHKFLPTKREVTTRFSGAKRPECRRIKHWIRRNWIKMYDKWSVLRIETVINNPYEFKVLKASRRNRGKKKLRWMPMGKGIGNLWRYMQIGEAANRRYLDALADVRPVEKVKSEIDELCRSRVLKGKPRAKFNPLAPQDCQVFEAVMAGEHQIYGFRNRDLRSRLYDRPAPSPEVAKRRCARTSRLISKLRSHRLVAKVQGQRLYRVTPRGQRVLGAVIRFRESEFPQEQAA
jgi:hypothetical protein